MAPKQGTKGQKQIYNENQSTTHFYMVMTGLFAGIHILLQLFSPWFFDPSTQDWVLIVSSVLIQCGALLFMKMMSKATHSSTGALLDAGLDVNMEGGFGEYCKDFIILVAASQFLSLFWRGFWLVLLCEKAKILKAPIYGMAKLWTSVISPWVFAPSAEPDAQQDDKQRKREQKVKYGRR